MVRFPLSLYHHWIHLEGFNDFVTSTWNSAPSVDSNGMRNLAGKLKFLKAHIKIWIKDNKSETVSTIANLKKELNQLDAVIDKGTGTEVEAEKRMEVLAALRNIDHIHSMDLAQKAKIKVGGSMTRVQAWQEIVEKVKSRLSKWKSKTLSIGGRLTLLKSVLGSIPVFHMSIFKVPSKVLHILESIRSHFFNGHDPGSKKASWLNGTMFYRQIRGGLDFNALESSTDVSVSSKIGDTSLVCSFRRIPRGGIEQNQFDSLVELVRSVTIVPSADRWNWNLESTGIFSVASARRRIDEICLPNNIGEEY
ncbi:hypothetical protein Tco_0985600 [Tanacetum coccineum]